MSETQAAAERMKRYIELHITQPISLRQLAEAAGYSPWHAARIFKAHTGKAPFDYIRKKRLSMAADTLRTGGGRVVDVAFDFVFSSHEGFTRAFSKQFGLTPTRYAKLVKRPWPAVPANAHEYYLTQKKGESRMDKNQNTVFVQVVDRPARRLILKRGVKAADYYAYCEEVGCGVWDTLTDVARALYEPMGMWLPKNLRRAGTSEYAQGVEVAADYAGDVPDGCEIIDLPPCQMMVFQGPPYDDEAFEDAIGELWQVMKNYDPTLYGFDWADEDAPRFQLIPLGYRGYIEARPVRAL